MTGYFVEVAGSLLVLGVSACVALLWRIDKRQAVLSEQVKSHADRFERVDRRLYRLERHARRRA